jgi:hypothetical protein
MVQPPVRNDTTVGVLDQRLRQHLYRELAHEPHITRDNLTQPSFVKRLEPCVGVIIAFAAHSADPTILGGFRPLGNYPETRASKRAQASFPAFSKNDRGLDLSEDLVSDCC